MTIEIEAKMRLDDVAAVEKALRDQGATLAMKLLETNTFFDTPEGDLKTGDQGLRIRVEQQIQGPHQAVIVTHKGPRAHGQLKSRSETEVAVSDAHDAGELLSALGYTPILSFEKERHRWLLDHCIIAIDRVPYLGRFIEIEGPSDAQVLAVRQRLHLDHAPLIRASYIAMLRTYLAEHNLHVDHVGFDDEKK